MYGWINGCLEDLVVEVYGVDIWEQIKLDANCNVPTGDFFRSVNYDDESTFNLVESVCKILDTTSDVILEAFGRHFIQFLEQNGYESAMRSQGNTLREWIKNVNEPHRLLRSRFPRSHLPEFWTENDDSDEFGETVLVHYYSTRGSVFTSVVVGIIKEAAKRYFDREVSMELVMIDESEHAHINFHAVWRIPNIGKDYSTIQSQTPRSPPLELNFLEKHSDWMASSQDDKRILCPFHSGNSGDKVGNSAVLNLSNPSEDSDNLTCIPLDVGLCGRDFRRIFPYHIVVDRTMQIIQVGGTMNTMMLQRGLSIIGQKMNELFTLTLPDSFPLNWNAIVKLRDVSIEMVISSVVLTQDDVKFRGEIMFLMEHCTSWSDANAQAVFLINPYIPTMNNLMDLDLSLNDLPRYSFQRDLLLLGEHLRSETDNGIKLGRLSKRLDHESKKAKDALKMKRIFVRYVSHEIRTPLNVCILGLKCLEDELKSAWAKGQSGSMPVTDNILPRNVSEVLDDVNLSCAVAVEILNDLLLYEKIDDGIYNVFPSKVPIRELIEKAEKLFRLQAQAASVDFVLDLHNKVLDTAIVEIDQSKLHQVLRNLVTNAIKFTPAHGQVRLTYCILQEEVYIDGLPAEPNSDHEPNGLPKAHFLPLLQRLERGRISRSDSISSLGSNDFPSDSIYSAKIHYANNVLENSMSPISVSTGSAPSVEYQSFTPLSGKGYPLSGASALTSKESKSWGEKEFSDSLLRTLSSNSPRKKRLHWEEGRDLKSVMGHNQSSANAFGVSTNSDDCRGDNTEPSTIVRKFVRISVQDTGPGISAEDQAQLFHEFIQVKADKLQNNQGSGLGLWIAANIMNMHGGRIGVFSEGEGKGSTFFIDIPLITESLATSLPSSPKQELHDASEEPNHPKRPRYNPSMHMDNDNLINLSPLAASEANEKAITSTVLTECPIHTQKRLMQNTRVLIVDDVASNRKVVRRILRDKFALIEEAENGKVAVNKVAQSLEQGNPFQLILMDFMMPVMNGLDATRAIQELTRQNGNLSHSEQTLIIGVTGNGLEEDIDAFKDAGADEVMLKPLEFTKFLTILQNHGFETSLNSL